MFVIPIWNANNIKCGESWNIFRIHQLQMGNLMAGITIAIGISDTLKSIEGYPGGGITDGMDMGVGTLLPFLGKKDEERRVIINTIGPHWDGNQVWFITAGGAIFAAWPPLYAVSFSGFYLAMFVVLAAFIVRPVAFKYRSKREGRNRVVAA